MTISSGLRAGLVSGLRSGLNPGSDPFASVTRDATSGIYVPSSSAEWTAFIAAAALSGIAVPNALWLMQEASGNLADAIGGFTLSNAATAATYAQSVAGWTRTGVRIADAATTAFKSNSASLPDIASASQFTMVIALVSSATATRRLISHGTSTTSALRVIASPATRAASGVNNADGTSPYGSVRPFGLRTNRTAGSTTGFTDVDKLVPTWSATVTGKEIVLGAQGGGACPTAVMLFAAQWHNANAEISDANYKTLLQAMGFTISWS